MTSPSGMDPAIIEEFRSNEGKLGGFFADSPVLLLSTIGARSGQRRTNPMMYLPDGNRWLVFASKGGAPTNPDWFHNLRANLGVTVEVGIESFEANAMPWRATSVTASTPGRASSFLDSQSTSGRPTARSPSSP